MAKETKNKEAEKAAEGSGPPPEKPVDDPATPESVDAAAESQDPIDNPDAGKPAAPDVQKDDDLDEDGNPLTPQQKAARTRARKLAERKAAESNKKVTEENMPEQFLVDDQQEAEKWFKKGYLVRKLQSGKGRSATFKFKVYKRFKVPSEIQELRDELPEELRGL